MSRLTMAFAMVLGSGFVMVAVAPNVAAAACAAPTTDLGTDTLTINVPATATYAIWTRMKAPDTSHNAINLEVDGNTCFNLGGGSFVSTSWANSSANWVNYQNGTASNTVSLNLTAGNHSFKYIGTQAGVEIDRVILSSDTSCTPTGTGDNCQSGDSTAPTVNLTAPTANQTLTGSTTFKATASDASGIAKLEYLVNGQVVASSTTSPSYDATWNSASIANGTASVSARATDTKNNVATTTPINVTINNAATCSGTPSVPSGLKVSGTTNNSVSLSWSASTPASGCTIQGYKVFRNGTQVTTATGTSFTDTGLNANTSYSYTIAAVDTASHASAQTTAVIGATSSLNDTTAPSVPANLRSTLSTASSVALAWDASTDNSGSVKDYVVFRNNTQVGTSATTAFTDSALAPSTTYSYTVKARDAAGNMSAASTALSVKTLAGTTSNKGDLNGDHTVNLTDLSILLSHWNQSNVPVSQGDVNGSGKVDLTDLSILLSNWNKSV